MSGEYGYINQEDTAARLKEIDLLGTQLSSLCDRMRFSGAHERWLELAIDELQSGLMKLRRAAHNTHNHPF